MKIRKAVSADAEALSDLLNEIIRAGGTTAIETTLSVAEFADWSIDGEFPLACHVAEIGSSLAGFQSLSAFGGPSKGSADIGTFARMNPKTKGVGSALFPATRAAAEKLGLEFINATIRPTMSAVLPITKRWVLRPMTGWPASRCLTAHPSTGSRSGSC